MCVDVVACCNQRKGLGLQQSVFGVAVQVYTVQKDHALNNTCHEHHGNIKLPSLDALVELFPVGQSMRYGGPNPLIHGSSICIELGFKRSNTSSMDLGKSI